MEEQTSISELDGAERYSLATYTRADNASPLIFACSYADFLSIDLSQFAIVAVTGNSMGWYTALACCQVIAVDNAINIVNAMGKLVHEYQVGGQIVYSLVDDEWRKVPDVRKDLFQLVDEINSRDDCEIHRSIELGGITVLAGTEKALELLEKEGPRGPGRFPIRLENHGAYHSPLMQSVSEKARNMFPAQQFNNPSIPIVDGRGKVWRPHASDSVALWDYTFGAQVTTTYDFSAAIQVAVREFAPDCIIALGPGDSLGGPIGQSLCAIDWRGIGTKQIFSEIQENLPFVLSMGRVEQRSLAA